MAEYLGYQGRPEPVDWLKIAKGAITDIDTIETDRQKQRDSLEKSADDLVLASKDYKPGQSGSFNELILTGADRVRSTTLDLKKQLMNGQITPTEYKTRVGRMSEDWKYLGDFAKSYNDIITKQVEYLNDPKASALGEYFLDKQSKLADVANKQLVVDPSTNGVVMTDPETGMVIDFKSLLIPENQTPERLDVVSEVERFTKGLGDTSKFLGGYWTTSPQLKAEYQKAKANFTRSMMQSSRGAASILADYVGGYEFYETEKQKKAIEASGGKAIQLVSGPNGIATPKLTSAQEDEARAVLDRLVDSRVDVEKEQPRPVEKSAGSRGDVNVNNRRELVNRIFDDPDSNRQYILNQPVKINNKEVQVVSVKPLEMMDKNRNPLKGIEINTEYDFVDPKTGKTKTTRELLTRSGDDAKRIINDLLNSTLTPGQSISYETVFFNQPGTIKSGKGSKYN